MRLLSSKFFDFLLGKARHLGDVLNLHALSKYIEYNFRVPFNKQQFFEDAFEDLPTYVQLHAQSLNRMARHPHQIVVSQWPG